MNTIFIDNEIDEVSLVLMAPLHFDHFKKQRLYSSYKVCALPIINYYTISSYSCNIPTLTRQEENRISHLLSISQSEMEIV